MTTEIREPVLCFVRGGYAYFTTQRLEEQRGEDWDDAPYESCAGPPSASSESPEDCSVLVYSYNGTSLETPAELSGCYTAYSVDDINAGAVAWLFGRAKNGTRKIAIYAGETLKGFERLIAQAGGTVQCVGGVLGHGRS